MKNSLSAVEPTYFTCTLGQAAEFNKDQPHDFQTINEFIDVQAKKSPQAPAVAFAVPLPEKGENFRPEVYTFEDLQHGSKLVAHALLETIREPIAKDQPCVGLICPSTAEFLFTWLGLMRAGFSVLLIAPQCQPDAIAHLCKSCDASVLFYDETYKDLASRAGDASKQALNAQQLIWQEQAKTPFESWIKGISPSSLERKTNFDSVFVSNAQSVAYIHHTSGTSTGLPKPIPQSHRAGVGVLPCIDGASKASFTTTPLYHGGVADCFRAWTSGALIWLFYGKIPITSANIKTSLEIAKKATESGHSNVDGHQMPPFPPVKYFSSVPYILQMLAEDKEGLNWLTGMDIVGVGGAALPDQVGASLTQNGVHLISRFGSAECGFLLSSHRDYNEDQAWQYLRAPPNSPLLKFELQNDGSNLSELVISKGWPHMAKVNRDDGSFATSDLFEPHPDIANAWRYHSRSDSQITLVTGKKFDPAPVEDAITASDSMIRDVMVFGSGKQVPGALIFVTEAAQNVPEKTLQDRVWQAVEAVNAKGQDHTRLSRDMIVVLKEGTLDKSSKGTLLRRPAEEKFAKEIEAAYSGEDDDNGEIVKSEDIKPIVKEIVAQVLGEDMDDETDFYQNGVDSAKATRMRTLLQKKLKSSEIELPWNVIYDCGNIKKLSQHIKDKLEKSDSMTQDYEEEMLRMVDQFSAFPTVRSGSVTRSVDESDVVLLTGATGSLGSHILHLLTLSSNTSRIYCLVRAKSDTDAKERTLQSLSQRRLTSDQQSNKIKFLACNLEQKDLGLSSSTLSEIHENVTKFIHAAWPVNFSLGLPSFAPSLNGLQNLISTATSTRNLTTFLFCSSTASVLSPTHPTPIPETLSTKPTDSDSLGYSQSKWVAEAICARAASHLASRQGCTIKVARIGQLTGNTKTGIWNMSEAYPLMLSTVRELKCLPEIGDMLDWLPVDEAARAVVEIAGIAQEDNDEGNKKQKANGSANGLQKTPVTGDCGFYHVLNDAPAASFRDLLTWLRDTSAPKFTIVDPVDWVKKLEGLEAHPAKALLGLWTRAYCSSTTLSESSEQKETEKIVFNTANAKGESAMMRNVEPVTKELVQKIWVWLEQEMDKKKM